MVDSRNIGWSKTLSEGCVSLASPAADAARNLPTPAFSFSEQYHHIAVLDLLTSVIQLHRMDVSTYCLKIFYAPSLMAEPTNTASNSG